MEKEDKTKYSITVDAGQAHIISSALDLYARVKLGQLEIVGEHIQHFAKKQNMLYYQMCDAFKELKPKLIGMAPNSSYGIGSKEVPASATEAFDIMQVVRHRLAWDNSPAGGTSVDFNPPMKWSSKELPKMEKI